MPYLLFRQAIRDAVRSVQYAFRAGVRAVSLEPIGVEPLTVTDLLYRAGLYKPPWLWSVRQVLQETISCGEVRIGGFNFSPLPTTLPRNCDQCSDRFIQGIDKYNLTYDLEVLNCLSCDCQETYRRDIAELDEEFDEEDMLQQLNAFVEDQMTASVDTRSIEEERRERPNRRRQGRDAIASIGKLSGFERSLCANLFMECLRFHTHPPFLPRLSSGIRSIAAAIAGTPTRLGRIKTICSAN